MKNFSKSLIPALVLIIATTFTANSSAAASTSLCLTSTSIKAKPVDLGRATYFGVIAAAAITNVGGSHLKDYIGVNPGTAITGIATIFINNSTTPLTEVHKSVTVLAQKNLITANDSITAQSVVGYNSISGELGEQTMCPGIYKSDAAFGLTGNLILDGADNPTSVFIFITPAAITTAAASKIILRNGAQAKNIFWQIGAAGTLGASSFFKGSLITQAAITSGAGVHVHGGLFSIGAAVTLDSTCILVPDKRVDFSCATE